MPHNVIMKWMIWKYVECGKTSSNRDAHKHATQHQVYICIYIVLASYKGLKWPAEIINKSRHEDKVGTVQEFVTIGSEGRAVQVSVDAIDELTVHIPLMLVLTRG